MNSFLKRISAPVQTYTPKESSYNVKENNNFLDTTEDFVNAQKNNYVQLPNKYNILLSQMEEIFAIFALKRNSQSYPKSIEFNKLRTGVEQGGHSFTQETLASILYLIPKRELVAKWVNDARLKRIYKLKVLLMQKPAVDEILKEARQTLTSALIKNHDQWCQRNKINVPQGITILHPNFPLQEQVLIPAQHIPPTPQSGNIDQFFVQERKQYEEIQPMIEEKKARFLSENSAFTTNKKIMDRYADKQVRFACWKEVYGKESEKQKESATLLSLNKIIRETFVSKKKTVLRLSDLFDGIRNHKQYTSATDFDTINGLVDKVVEKSNGVYELFTCQKDKFLRYNSKRQLGAV
ncbi:winged helix DNA-binding domain family, partial [Trichomonas vaginalis G3]|uniref:winged helix DNA-binding domain family n=1 Tax=Trichomonas vaginalis (strain ATCC PRA-98 / G3) TaxID=412133 RepID=UPI0021E55A88